MISSISHCSYLLELVILAAAVMGNGGSVNFETGQSEQGSSGSLSLSSASSNHLSGSISLSTGKGKQGPSGAISLQTGFSDHSAGGVTLHVGETGYRNGGEFQAAHMNTIRDPAA